jgi:hypothetical protein
VEAFLRSLAERLHIDLIDLSDAFEDYSVEQFRVSPWDDHPSVLGHLVLFEALKANLEARGGPPGLPLPATPYLPAPARRP